MAGLELPRSQIQDIAAGGQLHRGTPAPSPQGHDGVQASLLQVDLAEEAVVNGIGKAGTHGVAPALPEGSGRRWLATW